MSSPVINKFIRRVYREIEGGSDFSDSEIMYNVKTSGFVIKCTYNNRYAVYVELDKHYPFRPPTLVKINNQLYDHTTWLLSDNIKKRLFNDYKINCLYCHSMLCSKNWVAGLRIHNIIQEYEHNKIMIRALYAIDMLKNNHIEFLPEIERQILSFCFENKNI
jgi:hypothetical protein